MKGIDVDFFVHEEGGEFFSVMRATDGKTTDFYKGPPRKTAADTQQDHDEAMGKLADIADRNKCDILLSLPVEDK